MTWLIYALGGGLGHFHRGLALARRAASQGISISLLTNSPWYPEEHADFSALIPPEIDLLHLPPETTAEELRRRIPQLIRQRASDALIVDTFPRGIVGDLASLIPSLPIPKFLIHRYLNPSYIARYQLADFSRHYHALLHPGDLLPTLPPHPHSWPTEPWLLLDSHELHSSDASHEILSQPGKIDKPLIVCSMTGRPEEGEELHQWLRPFGETITFSRPEISQAKKPVPGHWPLLRFLPGIDLLIGSGGYHTVSETRATNVSLLAVSQKRLYDDQQARLHPHERVTSEKTLHQQLHQWLRSWSRAPGKKPIGYINGVHEACARIVSHMTSS